MELEQTLDNISSAILDLLQLVTYEAVRAHTFRREIYTQMIKENRDTPQTSYLRTLYEQEKEYATVLEYMSKAFREMKESEPTNDAS